MARLGHLSEQAKDAVRQRREAEAVALSELDAATGVLAAAVARRAGLMEVEDTRVHEAEGRRLAAAARLAEFYGVDAVASLTGLSVTDLRRAAAPTRTANGKDMS